MARLTFSEVAEVARLASAQRLTSFGSGPTTYGLADALGLPPDEIERLLDQSRRLNAAAPTDPKLKRTALIAGAVVAALAVIGLGVGMLASSHATSAVVTTGGPVVPVSPSFGAGVGTSPAASPHVPALQSGEVAELAQRPATRIGVDVPTTKVKSSGQELRNDVERAQRLAGDPQDANHPSHEIANSVAY